MEQRVEDRLRDLRHLGRRLVTLLVLDQPRRLFVQVDAAGGGVARASASAAMDDGDRPRPAAAWTRTPKSDSAPAQASVRVSPPHECGVALSQHGQRVAVAFRGTAVGSGFMDLVADRRRAADRHVPQHVAAAVDEADRLAGDERLRRAIARATVGADLVDRVAPLSGSASKRTTTLPGAGIGERTASDAIVTVPVLALPSVAVTGDAAAMPRGSSKARCMPPAAVATGWSRKRSPAARRPAGQRDRHAVDDDPRGKRRRSECLRRVAAALARQRVVGTVAAQFVFAGLQLRSRR